jgi:hypothetical protein
VCKSPEEDFQAGDRPSWLGDAIPPNSQFYIERSVLAAGGMGDPATLEAACCEAILQPGALVRVKGARQMGKTSLLVRLLHQAAQQNSDVALLSLQAVDTPTLQDIDALLQWFCQQVTMALQLPNYLDDYWDDLFGSSISCKSYFEEYLLLQSSQPLVLALDDVDRLFPYVEVADEFLGLLRAWHEDAKTRNVWKKLRLVLSHTMDVYIPLNIHKSPFNVGLPIELTALTLPQIQTLAERYELTLSIEQINQLQQFAGGLPYLTQLALQAMQQQQLSIEQLRSTAAIDSIYSDHLCQQWQILVDNPVLAEAFASIVRSTVPIEVDLAQSSQLQSLGFVTIQGSQAMPSCELYARYFQSL